MTAEIKLLPEEAALAELNRLSATPLKQPPTSVLAALKAVLKKKEAA